jgi:hypothetical protein
MPDHQVRAEFLRRIGPGDLPCTADASPDLTRYSRFAGRQFGEIDPGIAYAATLVAGAATMSDVAGLKVRGPVRTCRQELAEWDRDHDIWQTPRHLTVVTFRPDGQVSDGESHNLDGSVARWAHAYDDGGRLIEVQSWMNDGPRGRVLHSYDAAGRPTGNVEVAPDGTRREAETCNYDSSGRKTKVCFLPALGTQVNVCYGVEGTERAHGAPGAATMTVTYDDRERPAEATFHDANHALVRRIVFSRDRDGRLLTEVVHFGGETPFPDLPPDTAKFPPEERAKMAMLLAKFFADQTFASTAYAYDERGRLLERTMRMGSLSEERTTLRYDDHDDPIDQISESRSRAANVDDDGVVHTKGEMPRTQHTRFDYQYDEHGNWTERVVWSRYNRQLDLQRSNVIRRTITYYGAEPVE